MNTKAQQSIQHCLHMLAPFEASSETLAQGQLEFYQFIRSIYEKMYEEPEQYLVFPKPYEDYMKSASRREKARTAEKAHAGDSRESTLRNTFQHAIQFYASFFYYLGLEGVVQEKTGELLLTSEAYSGVLAKMNRFHDAQYNSQRYELLERLGIQIKETGEQVTLIHKTYKKAMYGLESLCRVPDSKYKFMNYLRLDYKNADGKIPSVEDIQKTLPEESAKMITQLEESLKTIKTKIKVRPMRGIVSDFRWKVDYTYKGKSICGFYADSDSLMICVHFNHFSRITEFATMLLEEDQELFEWYKNQFPERLCKCPNNRRVHFGEEARRICGLSNRTETVNPTNQDMENILYILERNMFLTRKG